MNICDSFYTLDEKKSLKFYKGDTEMDKEDTLNEFYSTSKAYLVLNSLMYDGIDNERIRIRNENKHIESKLFYHMEEIINVYMNLLTLMKKGIESREMKGVITTYRLDRLYSLECLKEGRLISFTSTSKNIDYDEKHFQKKDGLVIFNFKIGYDIPYIDVNEVLGDNTRYSSQKEVLLPPFISVCMKEIPLNEKERSYRDVNNNPPIGKFEIVLMTEINREDIVENKDSLMKFLSDIDNINNAVEVIDKMNLHMEPDANSVDRYVEWKRCFQKLIRIYYNEILG